MDGDIAPLAELRTLADEFNAFLYADEAHATGVLGDGGWGLCKGSDTDLVMGTFSKALGGFGAYICCSAALRDYLINRCAAFIYATALPPSVLGAMDAALELVPQLDAERARLRGYGEKVRARCAELGLDNGGSQTQIVPIVLGSAERALAAAELLRGRGLLGVAIRPPTVPPNASRIRLALSAAHTPAELDQLCDALSAIA
jgi:8-amino-7-oxononanoate synthase